MWRWGRCVTGGAERGLPMHQSDRVAVPPLTPLRLIAGVAVFVLGLLAGVGGAMWILPPS
jgi:hypothetical protein